MSSVEIRILISALQYRSLLSYPETEFGSQVSTRWVDLCEKLRTFERDHQTTAFPRVRKWELVSALQKCIRRGDVSLSRKLMSLVEGTKGEAPYLWRRLPVIACEDIGLGDLDLTIFCIACSHLFTPVRDQAAIFDVFTFLVLEMSCVAKRSRMACDLACIEQNLRADAFQNLPSLEDQTIVSAIETRVKRLRNPDTPWRRWQQRNDWRGSQLLRFVDVNLGFLQEASPTYFAPHRVISQLPSYCYDMHTRVGRAVLSRLIEGADGAMDIPLVLRRSSSPDKRFMAIGEAVFFEEGGLLAGEIVYRYVSDLNQRLFASHFGLDISSWRELRRAVRVALDNGLIDALREEQIGLQYAQLALFPD